VRTFDPDTFRVLAAAEEVHLLVPDRETGIGKPVTIWITPHDGRLYIRSGAGLGRAWVRNMLAHGGGEIHSGGLTVPFRARHVIDPAEARAVAASVAGKYEGEPDVAGITGRLADAPPLPAETATFEVVPLP
jgi:hypothetical protein